MLIVIRDLLYSPGKCPLHLRLLMAYCQIMTTNYLNYIIIEVTTPLNSAFSGTQYVVPYMQLSTCKLYVFVHFSILFSKLI